MAIYSASTKVIGRAAGRSAVAAAAYRAGVALTDERQGLAHDYTRKGGVVSAEIVAPDGGSADRAALWNAAERAETRKDGRTAREWVVALPAELDAGQRAELARAFGRALASRYGVAVDVAIHAPGREGDQRNHHAHLLCTTRQVSRDAAGGLVLGEKAAIELSDTKRRSLGLDAGRDEVEKVRSAWADLTNRALEQAGRAERVDHRSYERQGLDREAGEHLGPAVTAQERRGVETERGDRNRAVGARHERREELRGQILDLKAERERRERGREAAEARRLDDMTAQEIRAEIQRIRPPSAAALVTADREVIRTAEASRLLGVNLSGQRGLAERSRREIEAFRQAHPFRAWLHDKGLVKAPPLDQAARQVQAAEAAIPKLAAQDQEAGRIATATRDAATKRIIEEQRPALAKVAALERKAAEREALETAAMRADLHATQAVQAFKTAAAKRHHRLGGWGDQGSDWKALPAPVREQIEAYNRMLIPSQERRLEQLRETWRKAPEAARQLTDVLRARGQERGLGRG